MRFVKINLITVMLWKAQYGKMYDKSMKISGQGHFEKLKKSYQARYPQGRVQVCIHEKGVHCFITA